MTEILQVIHGPFAAQLSGVDQTNNSAWLAASKILSDHWSPMRKDFSLRMTLHKYLPVGSGLGSSAASAVAAAKAVIEMLGLSLQATQIIHALKLAEEVTSGTGYPDNVVPSYFGGLFLMNEGDADDEFPNGAGRASYVPVSIQSKIALSDHYSPGYVNAPMATLGTIGKWRCQYA